MAAARTPFSHGAAHQKCSGTNTSRPAHTRRSPVQVTSARPASAPRLRPAMMPLCSSQSMLRRHRLRPDPEGCFRSAGLARECDSVVVVITILVNQGRARLREPRPRSSNIRACGHLQLIAAQLTPPLLARARTDS